MKKALLVFGLFFSLSTVGCSHWGHRGDCGGREHGGHGGCGSCCQNGCKEHGKKEGHDCGKKGDEGCKMKHADQAPAGAPADAAKTQAK